MKTWLVISWNQGTFIAHARNDFESADAGAHTWNAILCEVHICEKDFLTYFDLHDYEYQNKKREPVPVEWREIHGDGVSVQFVRVGKDIPRAQYLMEHSNHG